MFWRLRVVTAQDWNFRVCGDSNYHAGKSFSSFKLGELMVLIQFDVDQTNPADDRFDFLVKRMIQGDPKEVTLAQVKYIHEIIKKLEILCIPCCPDLRYDEGHKASERYLEDPKHGRKGVDVLSNQWRCNGLKPSFLMVSYCRSDSEIDGVPDCWSDPDILVGEVETSLGSTPYDSNQNAVKITKLQKYKIY